MKPLPPSNVSCTRTSVGYQILWSYIQIPGRPQPQYFLIEYRRLNSSLKWKSLEVLIGWDRRQWSISDIVNPNILYEFRMFSFSGQFSEPSNVAKITVIGMCNVMRSLTATSCMHAQLLKKEHTIAIEIIVVVTWHIKNSQCFVTKLKGKQKLASCMKRLLKENLHAPVKLNRQCMVFNFAARSSISAYA